MEGHRRTAQAAEGVAHVVDSNQDRSVDRVVAERAAHAGAAAQGEVQCVKNGFVSSNVHKGLRVGRDEVAEGPSVDLVFTGLLQVVVVGLVVHNK